MAINNSITGQDQINLQNLFSQVKQLYKQLKQCEHFPIQSAIIWSIKPKCQQILKILNKASEQSQYIIKKKQIMQIKAKIEQIQQKNIVNQKKHPQIGHGGRIIEIKADKEYSQEHFLAQFSQEQQSKQFNIDNYANIQTSQEKQYQKYANYIGNYSRSQSSISRQSLQILTKIAHEEMKSIKLDYTKQQLDQVLNRLKVNQQVVQHVEGMINQQGNNLQKVQQSIEKAYSNVQQMNVQLNQAEKEQIKSVNKLRTICKKTLGGFWGFLSWPFKKIFKHKSTPITTPSSTRTSGPDTVSTPKDKQSAV